MFRLDPLHLGNPGDDNNRYVSRGVQRLCQTEEYFISNHILGLCFVSVWLVSMVYVLYNDSHLHLIQKDLLEG